MPAAPQRPCCNPDCANLVSHGYCAECRPSKARGNSTARGYDHTWREFRKRFLWRHTICEIATILRSETCDRMATEVHHKAKLADNPHLRLVESNLAALCKPCHSRLTAKGF